MKTAMERMMDFMILNPESSLTDRLDHAEFLRDHDEREQIVSAHTEGKRNVFSKSLGYYNDTLDKEFEYHMRTELKLNAFLWWESLDTEDQAVLQATHFTMRPWEEWMIIELYLISTTGQ